MQIYKWDRANGMNIVFVSENYTILSISHWLEKANGRSDMNVREWQANASFWQFQMARCVVLNIKWKSLIWSVYGSGKTEKYEKRVYIKHILDGLLCRLNF